MLNSNPQTPDELAFLPYYSALLDYGDERWIGFGTLTHAHETPAVLQIERGRDLMHAIGRENDCFGDRLHWIIRAEGGHVGKDGADPKDEARTHLHFLLSGHRIIDGHLHPFSPEEARSFLENNWEYGRAEVKPYLAGQCDLAYLLKCRGGPQSPAWDDRVELSRSLLSELKERRDLMMPLGLQRFAAKRLAQMRNSDRQKGGNRKGR
jgi:hypothetical protein